MSICLNPPRYLIKMQILNPNLRESDMVSQRSYEFYVLNLSKVIHMSTEIREPLNSVNFKQ